MTNTAEQVLAVNLETPLTNDQLVQEALQIDDYCKQQQKALADFLKQYRDRADWIDKVLLHRMITQGQPSIKTNSGTAYKSTIVTPKVVDRELRKQVAENPAIAPTPKDRKKLREQIRTKMLPSYAT